MEGNMRGPSSLDCEKSFARTRIPTANMILKAQLSGGQDRTSNALLPALSLSNLVQITIQQ
jgi:hypothetical protein